MAIILLTSAQKNALLSNTSFANQVKWAVLDKAVYWAGHNGSTPPGGLERWRKSKTLALTIQNSPSMADSFDIVKRFLVSVKNTPCVNDQVTYDEAAVITYLLSGSGTNQFDVMSDAWFDQELVYQP